MGTRLYLVYQEDTAAWMMSSSWVVLLMLGEQIWACDWVV